jgi:hypothetical protein
MTFLNTIFLVTLYFVSAIFYPQADHGRLQIKNIANPPISKISYSSSEVNPVIMKAWIFHQPLLFMSRRVVVLKKR